MTFHQVRAEALKSHEARQNKYNRGGTVHSDEAADRELIKEMVKPKDLKKGGQKVEGRAAGGHVNRPGKAKTTVNVIIPPSAPPASTGAPMIPPRPPVMAGPPPQMPPRPMAPPPQPGMGPMGGMPPGGAPPPGMMPRSRGGRTKHRDMGGATGGMPGAPPTQSPQPQPPVNAMPRMAPPVAPPRASTAGGLMPAGAAGPAAIGNGGAPPPGSWRRGGRTERARGGGLDAGAASGEGRIEKAKNGRKGSMIEYGD